jgi:hypothetical protein
MSYQQFVDQAMPILKGPAGIFILIAFLGVCFFFLKSEHRR